MIHQLHESLSGALHHIQIAPVILRETLLGILPQNVRQSQDPMKRCSQLMGDVADELCLEAGHLRKFYVLPKKGFVEMTVLDEDGTESDQRGKELQILPIIGRLPSWPQVKNS